MFTIRFDVHRKILVIYRIVKPVVFLQPINLGFRNGGNLTFVGVKRSDRFGGRAIAADGAEGIDQSRGLRLFFRRAGLFAGEAERFDKSQPERGMIRFAGFFIDQIRENFLPRRLIVALRVRRRKIGGEGRDVMIILLRIISERFFGQLTTRPGEVERMRKQMPGGDLLIDRLKRVVHKKVVSRSFSDLRLAKKIF